MLGRTHIIGGLTVAAATISYTNMDLVSGVAFAGLCTVGSLLPDIDHPNSIIGKSVPFISKPLSKIFGHRKAFHAPATYALIAYAMLYYGVSPLITWGLMFGVASHLLLDMLTKGGVPLLWPILPSKTKLTFASTGGGFEAFCGFMMVLGSAYCVVKYMGII